MTTTCKRPTSLAENRTEAPLLRVEDLTAGYGRDPVIAGISLRFRAGEIACIIGPNGAGKSTLLKAITNEAVILGGRVELRGQNITRLPAAELARRGVGWVPQLNDVFSTLTVRENLEMGGYQMPPREVSERVEQVLALFPILRPLEHRTAGKLSGCPAWFWRTASEPSRHRAWELCWSSSGRWRPLRSPNGDTCWSEANLRSRGGRTSC